MYTELCCYDRNASEDDVRQSIFLAAQYKLNGVSFPSHFLQSNKDFVIPGMTLSSPVDFPYGSSDKQIRNSAVLTTIKKGATTIDMVANHHLLITRQSQKFAMDVESNLEICKKNNAKLRLFLDYQLMEKDELITVCRNIHTLGIEEAFLSTGGDDYEDNLAIGMLIQTRINGLNIITNGNFWKPEQFDVIRKSKIYGVRFRSIFALKNIFGV